MSYKKAINDISDAKASLCSLETSLTEAHAKADSMENKKAISDAMTTLQDVASSIEKFED